IGKPAKSAQEILDAFAAAITPRTRIVSVAHCDTVTGTITPVKQIAELAHAKGALCFVDGAQALGVLDVNLRDLGVDAYATTCHKWLASPAADRRRGPPCFTFAMRCRIGYGRTS